MHGKMSPEATSVLKRGHYGRPVGNKWLPETLRLSAVMSQRSLPCPSSLDLVCMEFGFFSPFIPIHIRVFSWALNSDIAR